MTELGTWIHLSGLIKWLMNNSVYLLTCHGPPSVVSLFGGFSSYFLYKVLYFTGRGGFTPGAVRLQSSVQTGFCRVESRCSQWKLPDKWQQQISKHSYSQTALPRTERAPRWREDRSHHNSTSNAKLKRNVNVRLLIFYAINPRVYNTMCLYLK